MICIKAPLRATSRGLFGVFWLVGDAGSNSLMRYSSENEFETSYLIPLSIMMIKDHHSMLNKYQLNSLTNMFLSKVQKNLKFIPKAGIIQIPINFKQKEMTILY